ncbi:MAG: hypothetical protein SNG49_08055 [Rikenellaceae bacterium]
MKNLLTSMLLLTCVMSIISCQTNLKHEHLFDSIEYITELEPDFSFDKGVDLYFGMYGVRSLSIIDSLMVVTTANNNGCWSFFNLNNDYNLEGNHITIGRGRNEFLYTPWVADNLLYKDADDIFSIAVDAGGKRVYKLNVTQTLEDDKLSCEGLDFKIPSSIYRSRFLNSKTLFATTISDDKAHMERFILKNGEEFTNENMDRLDMASIDLKVDENGGIKVNDINVLGAFLASNPAGDIVVEVPLVQNYINIYSIDEKSSFSKTLCFGEKITQAKEIQNLEYADRVAYFKGITTFEDYFGVIYLNDTNGNFSDNLSESMKILFINWKGKLLGLIEIQDTFNCFSIDFAHGDMYTLNYGTDEILRYDVKDVIRSMNSRK